MHNYTPKQLCQNKLYNNLNKNNSPSEVKTMIVADNKKNKKIIQNNDMCLEDYLKSLKRH